jgi:hypothetical protein
MRTDPFTTILNTDLAVVKRIPTDDGQDAQYWPEFISNEKIHCNVDRATLREIVLLGLADCCHFNKRLPCRPPSSAINFRLPRGSRIPFRMVGLERPLASTIRWIPPRPCHSASRPTTSAAVLR